MYKACSAQLRIVPASYDNIPQGLAHVRASANIASLFSLSSPYFLWVATKQLVHLFCRFLVGVELAQDLRHASRTSLQVEPCYMCDVQVKQLVEWGAEGVIVGSALVKALASGDSPAEGLEAMEKLARELRGAMP